jgi:guanylate kinase
VSVLLVIAGPSGVGKGTIVRSLLERDPRLWFSVSANTRDPRPGEVEGRDYLFVTHDVFEAMRAGGEFLEWFRVYDDLKGTPRGPVESHLAAGDDVLVEVDVQGALAIREAFSAAFLVFVRPPSREVQRERLVDRDPSADPGQLEVRLAQADAEEALADQFDAVVVNDDVDRAIAEIQALLEGRRASGGGS